ncbi:uncharacterized protein SCHCODRAFT_01039260 [Schizophyllum commune H4-8]|uniref:Expressed protein n=1 Tax=Schizophyllum commune (strain H4-8 / FGSC 9210) TaxID=578458 RepID=D8QDT9_SCHCM|nr:uncharacterized protein SCHCODRAFT_01039260 [Schizophyllum commune H4-8]KAI5888580.1 hypothetical protein SCHCODRAFT_01039260 [Schizophyllum commune H4-8]
MGPVGPSNPDAHASAMDIDACGSSEGGVDLATVLGLRDADLEKALEIWDTLKNHPLGDEMLATVLERAWAQHLAAMEKKPAASAIDFFPPLCRSPMSAALAQAFHEKRLSR